jgi:xanthine dehydrogenase molybdopterin-binding subunit B
VVLATSLKAAAHAAPLVDVRYSSWPSLTDIDAPQAVTQPGHFIRDYTRGDADQAIRRPSVVTDLQFSIARNNHNPMELPATIAKWDGEKLTVWNKVQSISSAQHSYADAMGVPQENVRVISPFVGGASIHSRSVKFSNVTNTTGSSQRISADLLILARTVHPSQCCSSTTRFASASTLESAHNAAGTVWKISGNASPANLSWR